MDEPTVEVYERHAADYATRRGVQHPERARAFAAAVGGARRLDVGCGPGLYLPLLGRPVVALDAAAAMVAEVGRRHPEVPAVRGELGRLPFRAESFGGVWASKAHQHVASGALPAALAEVQRVLVVGGRFDLTVFEGDGTWTSDGDDDLPGRLFTWWRPEALSDLLVGAGFSVDEVQRTPGAARFGRLAVVATRLRSLPDHVGPGMRLLCCGLNPSERAADAGVGFVTPGNRFWPALRAAGLATVDRDPRRLLADHAIGMTDLVKRATPRVADLAVAEHRAGVGRLTRLCHWLQPAALCVVGLAGWRAAIDRRAVVGWQPEPLGGVPVYLMPSTSGLNAATPLRVLADHLGAAAAGP